VTHRPVLLVVSHESNKGFYVLPGPALEAKLDGLHRRLARWQRQGKRSRRRAEEGEDGREESLASSR
jgi:hypothetical protein